MNPGTPGVGGWQLTIQALGKTPQRWTSSEPERPEALGRRDPEKLTQTTHTPLEAQAKPGAGPAIARFLRSFQVLLGAVRLYQKNHPRVLESLEAAGNNLRGALDLLSPVAIRIDGGCLVVPALEEQSLPEFRGELNTLAEDLSRCGITSLIFLRETNLGELDTLAGFLKNSSQKLAGSRTHLPDWPVWLAEHRFTGIRINCPMERKVDTMLASLFSALLVYGGGAQPEAAETPDSTASEPSAAKAEKTTDGATLEEISAALRLLARIAIPLEQGRDSSPQEAAREFHALLAEADRGTVSQLATAMSRQAPRDTETHESYIARLADSLVLEFVGEEFRSGRATPPELRELLARLASELAGEAVRTVPRATGAAASKPGTVAAQAGLSVTAQWADEAYAERLYENFWAESPPREKSAVLRSRDAWCLPATVLRRYLEQLAGAGYDSPDRASPREARLVLLNYARCLESVEGNTRRAVAAGLAELHPVVEQLWPNQLPEELGGGVLRALAGERSPGIAALLSAVTENLARLALSNADYAQFERIVEALEGAPRDAEHAHLFTLAGRIVVDERWVELVDAALFHWPRPGQGADRRLDPFLTRLLRRDPERLLDRLALLLTAPNGLDTLPAMARLLRVIGEPALGALEARLYEPRRQRAAAAVKLLAATEPERLAAALPRALPSWEWNLQDLAVSELSRLDVRGTAGAFAAAVMEAHPMVVPMMLDQIGLAQETAAVPVLLQIAAGENDRLRDIFTRIKAVEALGRLRVREAADMLRAMLRQRNGLTHAEPAGLRAAAEEALALIENRPSSARVRAAHEALERASLSFSHPRRYLRIALSSPFTAQIEGPRAGPARVRTISLGGAFLESGRQLAVGDPIRVEIRTGLRRIQGTAVVRNVAPNGGGVEFVHMRQDDRERLRRLVNRLLHR